MVSGNHLSPGPMLTFPHLRLHQIAYVTTDLDEALRRVEDAFGLSQYYFINTLEQLSHPQQPGLRIALVSTAGTEFARIEPQIGRAHVRPPVTNPNHACSIPP